MTLKPTLVLSRDSCAPLIPLTRRLTRCSLPRWPPNSITSAPSSAPRSDLISTSRAIDPVPNPVISVPGLGPVITGGLLAEIVDVSRFPDDGHLAQHFGITRERRSTGNFSLRTPG